MMLDASNRRDFKRAYDAAYAANSDPNSIFLFQGQEVLLHYAYYLLEHLVNETKDKSLRGKRPVAH